MNPITFSLKPQMQGPHVGDLQTALLLVLDRGKILLDTGSTQEKVSAALRREHTEQRYTKVTSELVRRFQITQHLEASRAVDQPTADALNRSLEELTGTRAEQSGFAVKGTVRLSDSTPVVGLKVSAFDRDLRSEQLLGQSITGRKGSYQIQYTSDAFAKAEARSADLIVKAFAANSLLLAASPVLFNAPPGLTRIDFGGFAGREELAIRNKDVVK